MRKKLLLDLAGVKPGNTFNVGEKVTVEFTPELKEQFDELGKSMNAVKTENMTAMNAVKTELNGKIDAQGKSIEKIEAAVNMISITSNEAKKNDPKRGFRNHLDFFNAVILAGMNGMRPDKMDARLVPLFNTVGSDEARVGSNPDGGFLTPPAFLPGLLTSNPNEIQVDTGLYTRKIPMGSRVVYVNARVDKNHTSSVSGGFQIYRRAETDTVTATKQTFEQIKLEANSLMGLSYASEEILATSPQSFSALIQTGFGDEKTSKGNYERIWGSGVGEYCGIMNSAAKIAVAKVGSQTATTINGTNLVAMRARAWRYGSSLWMANHDTLPQLMSCHIALTNGSVPLFAPGNGTDKPDTLFGRPIIFDENMATLGQEGDIALINWNEYLEGTLGGTSFDESIHVRFIYGERAFRFTVYNDGQPWWRTALTPKKSATTLSPFVTLAVRG